MLQLAANQGVVAVEQGVPAAVAQTGRTLAGADDVGEQDRGQHPVGFGAGSGYR